MRFVSKFYILVALAGCSILFSVRLLWMSSDYMPISPGHDPAFQVTEKRLVVFGDSWSDSASRDEEQGPLWTEWLCSMVNKHRFHPVLDKRIQADFVSSLVTLRIWLRPRQSSKARMLVQ